MSNRQPWSEKEKDACSRMFVKSLAVGYLPGKKEIIDAQQKEPILQARTWIQIKNCIRNMIKKNKTIWIAKSKSYDQACLQDCCWKSYK